LSLISCLPADHRPSADYAFEARHCALCFPQIRLYVYLCVLIFLPLRVICLSVFLLFCVAKLQFIVFSLLALRVTCIIHEMEKYSLFFACVPRALMLRILWCTGSIQISSRLIPRSLLKTGLESRSNLSTAERRVIKMLVVRNFVAAKQNINFYLRFLFCSLPNRYLLCSSFLVFAA
jgi:hypothetical protein